MLQSPINVVMLCSYKLTGEHNNKKHLKFLFFCGSISLKSRGLFPCLDHSLAKASSANYFKRLHSVTSLSDMLFHPVICRPVVTTGMQLYIGIKLIPFHVKVGHRRVPFPFVNLLVQISLNKITRELAPFLSTTVVRRIFLISSKNTYFSVEGTNVILFWITNLISGYFQ